MPEDDSTKFSRLARKRWAKMKKAQRTEATAAATAASPVTKKRPTACKKCGTMCEGAREAWNHCLKKKAAD